MYQICRELRVSYQSLHLWIAIYKEEGEQGLRNSFKSQKSPTKNVNYAIFGNDAIFSL